MSLFLNEFIVRLFCRFDLEMVMHLWVKSGCVGQFWCRWILQQVSGWCIIAVSTRHCIAESEKNWKLTNLTQLISIAVFLFTNSDYLWKETPIGKVFQGIWISFCDETTTHTIANTKCSISCYEYTIQCQRHQKHHPKKKCANQNTKYTDQNSKTQYTQCTYRDMYAKSALIVFTTYTKVSKSFQTGWKQCKKL